MKIHKIISLIIMVAALSACENPPQIEQTSETSNSTEEAVAASSTGASEKSTNNSYATTETPQENSEISEFTESYDENIDNSQINEVTESHDENTDKLEAIEIGYFWLEPYYKDLMMGNDCFVDVRLFGVYGFEFLINENDLSSFYNLFDLEYQNLSIRECFAHVSKFTDLDKFPNLYSFICYFNLSEEQIREVINLWGGNDKDLIEYYNENEYIDHPGAQFDYAFSEEQIKALISKDKIRVLESFKRKNAIIKGDKGYSPFWFCYATVEDLRDENFTLDELKMALEIVKASQVYPEVLNHLEKKIYELTEGTIDVIEWFGYDRDMTMPNAFDYFSWNKSDAYLSFFHYQFQTKPYSIDIKGNLTYTLEWVYYNKPQAYREAGITPAELREMLPKYKELGILSKEALAALENKIKNYK